MKKGIVILTAALIIFTIPVLAMSDMMTPGFISRAEVTDGITVDTGGWVWTWPSVIWGFGVNGTGELGNKFINNLAVGAGVSYDMIKWQEAGYEGDKWSNIGIAAYAKYQIFSAEEMKKKVDFLPIYLSALGGLKCNIYTLTINGVKYSIGDDVAAYYNYYDNLIVINAIVIADYPLKYITDSNFLKNITVTGYSGLINSYFSGGIDFWYKPEDQNFSVKLGWIPLLGVSVDFLFNI